MPVILDIRIDDPAWEHLPDIEALCQKAVDAAELDNMGEAHIDLLLTNDEAITKLNTDWRGKAKPTDVLSFPADENPENFLGDIAIAYGITSKDAETYGKTLANHVSHLLIHGYLHLCGHDHIQDDEAEIMENLEREALASLGVSDPYSRIVTK